jgi:hypothetical protein
MTTYTSVNPTTLHHAAADTQQLIHPIHIAIRRRIITHPPLLDQLRQATTPGRAQRGPERRSVPRSRPPAALDALDALAAIYVDLAGWHARLHLPTPPHDTDWQKAALRALADRMPHLAGDLADWAATEIHDWWRLAAIHTGWRPHDLQKLR